MARLVLLGALLCTLRVGSSTLDSETLSSPTPHNCPYNCTCAADLLSCAGLGLQDVPAELPAFAADLDLSHNALQHLPPGWLTPLSRLRALRLGHNELEALSRGVFINASSLRLLDLSSNVLRRLGRHDLHGLGALEMLLLFNNRLAHLDQLAFRGLGMLRRLYLGSNELASFSFDHLHGLSSTHLHTLDLSSNHLGQISIPDLAALPAFLKNGLYLHNNPLPCDCRLYYLLQRWHQRGLSAVSDFAREYMCLAFKVPTSRVRFFEPSRVFENCSAALARGLEQPEEQLQVQVGQPLRLHCNTSAPALRVAWVSPQHELLVAPGSPNGSIAVMGDGSLAISSVQPWHEGVFVCLATGPHLHHNQTHEYNVSVHFPHPEPEAFNTSYTTLLGCAVGLVLVLLYLFAPPCPGCRRCYRRTCHCWPRAPSPLQELSAQSSVLSSTPPDAPSRKASVHKHVVFLEPGRKGLDGRVQLAVAEDFDLYNPMGLRLKAASESTSSTGSEGLVMA
ncbi:adhesion molecule with Ig like domain 3 [Phyllostomus discolor]|uniref:Amphoterin-induced protein 3 n=1 Tax=Phyllostomus discolor TaxID=89673 RepID=A0A6J2M600_9CHIR|nr:amphoterin-induced protein 3 [Phyllostomus discolor]KAF6098464.1 adhesion molecule with Ig like domain 3 [Phyllostomus discolor]